MPQHHLDVDAPGLAGPRRRVAYPGELGAAPIGVSFELPGDWATSPVQGALALARAPRPDAFGLHANLVLSVDRVDHAQTLSSAALSVLGDARLRADQLVVLDERVVEVAGLPGVRREQRLQVVGRPAPLTQFVLLVLVEVAGAMRDCVQVTVTGDADQHDDLRRVFSDVCDTLRLGA